MGKVVREKEKRVRHSERASGEQVESECRIVGRGVCGGELHFFARNGGILYWINVAQKRLHNGYTIVEGVSWSLRC